MRTIRVMLRDYLFPLGGKRCDKLGLSVGRRQGRHLAIVNTRGLRILEAV